MALMKLCSKCGRRYEVGSKHECTSKLIDKSERNRTNESERDPIHSTKWRKFRKRIIIRDGGYCQRCKVLFNKYEFNDLEVHHIKPRTYYPELIFDENNCVTICSTCNKYLGLTGIDFKWEAPKKE